MKRSSFGTIVLINSRALQLNSLKNAFKNYNGSDCIAFEWASEAMRFLHQAAKIDLVIVEWLGMDVDVFDFLEQIRSWASCVNSRIILCGPSNTKAEIRANLLSKGADYYMIEPYEAEKLIERVEMLMTNSQTQLFGNTIWDAQILHEMQAQPFCRSETGYRYIAACLQQWLTCEDIPQMQTVFNRVAEQVHISTKGVESGVTRALRNLAKAQGLKKAPTCKEWFSDTAHRIRFAYEEKGREEDHAEQERQRECIQSKTDQ